MISQTTYEELERQKEWDKFFSIFAKLEALRPPNDIVTNQSILKIAIDRDCRNETLGIKSHYFENLAGKFLHKARDNK